MFFIFLLNISILFYVSVALVSFSLFIVLSSILYVTCIITCDRPLYFTSLITCITPCDIGDRTSYLFSLIERLLALLHVLVVVTVDFT